MIGIKSLSLAYPTEDIQRFMQHLFLVFHVSQHVRHKFQYIFGLPFIQTDYFYLGCDR